MALSRISFPDSAAVGGAPATSAPLQKPRALAGPILFVECTYTYQHDLNTGIQRVVRNIVRHSGAIAAAHGYRVVPVVLEDGRFVAADVPKLLADKQRRITPLVPEPEPEAAPETGKPAVAASSGGPSAARMLWRLSLRVLSTLLPFESVRRFLYAPSDRFGLAYCLSLRWRARRRAAPSPQPTTAVATMPIVPELAGAISLDEFADLSDSVLLLLDSSWPTPLWPAVDRFKARGGRVAGVIYDLIPITHAASCADEATAVFTAWLHDHVRRSDAFICISRSVASQLRAFFRADADSRPQGETVPIDHFHLGSELDLIDPAERIRPEIRRVFKATASIFLMVGSIEPRKNHAYVLDAFERVWQAGGTAALMIIGREQWKTEPLLARIAAHEQLGRRLFICRDASDAELDHAYRHASALVMASVTEGFGLPIVEALQHGLPILCSDIPVFREIADCKARFFDLSAPDHLTCAIQAFCRRRDHWHRLASLLERWADRRGGISARAAQALARACARRHRARKPAKWLSWHDSTARLISTALRVRASAEPGLHVDQRAAGSRNGLSAG